MNQVVIDFDEVSAKLVGRLNESGWGEVLKDLMQSTTCKRILEHLHAQSQMGKRFTPVLKQAFRAFELCPWNKLKVVIIGQDPYPQPGVADGIAFSCGNTHKAELSLRYLFDAIRETVYPDQEHFAPAPDLSRWSAQGVLMLNAALTTQVGYVGQHHQVWRPFISEVLRIIDKSIFAGLVFVFLGQQAASFAALIDDKYHFKYFVDHPASARYRTDNRWNCRNIFNEVNRVLQQQDLDPVDW